MKRDAPDDLADSVPRYERQCGCGALVLSRPRGRIAREQLICEREHIVATWSVVETATGRVVFRASRRVGALEPDGPEPEAAWSILPCNLDLVALGVIVGDCWDLDELYAHINGCGPCKSVYEIMTALTCSRAGRTGRGAKKRRGTSAYYRELAKQRRRAQGVAQ